ncbi:MAG: YbaB/EbfC family nucleoid-associated protein [Candidatus Edwardsbacteria bacterium]|nr:YbaB/EbfC family nucleoid-associated protein [Candidatus Edwardsbacteria bacterium]MBU1576565.1 YbaB/EbfC family nucleoid-associated protein [Candidatus Edwardsbacteria bacterium]MBU2463389.1 YbaB/EbfC family nucleoid-associated protein [Candidatus Edwardsbacteria bacterium]MBU2594760.1 YbaB/EbfC family nucleoid-associated protein [Candidatus Edwardsbacteria bacterium]
MAKGMGDILKQAQMMQTKMESIQKELANKRVEASVGGGMVKVTADGQQNILDIKISPEIIKPEEADMLQDLVLSGVQEAIKMSRDLAAKEMSGLTGGMSLPGMF